MTFVIYLHRPAMNADGQLGDDASAAVKLFDFSWNDVRAVDSETLQADHAIFNQAFATAFPRILYTNPFTSYTGTGIGIGSQITGLGETRLDDATLKAQLLNALRAVGIDGDESKFTLHSSPVGANTTLPATPGTVNKVVTTDGQKSLYDQIAAWGNTLAIGLGISTTVLMVIGGVVGYSLLKDKL